MNADGRGYIRFADHHVGGVLNGKKTLTIRLEFERDFSAGDRIDLVDEDDHRFGTATIASVGEMTALQAVKQDLEGHREYSSVSELAAHLRRYYPDADFWPGSRVHIIRLEDVQAARSAATDGGQADPSAFAIPTIEDLDTIRVAYNISQKELSRRAGMEPGRFHHILRNDVDPQTNTMRSFLETLQDADPRRSDEVDRTGPKPEPTSADDNRTDGGREGGPSVDSMPPVPGLCVAIFGDYQCEGTKGHNGPHYALGGGIEWEDESVPRSVGTETNRTDGGNR